MEHGVACRKCVEQCLHEKHNGCANQAPVPAAGHPRFLKTVLDDGFMRSFTVCYFFSIAHRKQVITCNSYKHRLYEETICQCAEIEISSAGSSWVLTSMANILVLGDGFTTSFTTCDFTACLKVHNNYIYTLFHEHWWYEETVCECAEQKQNLVLLSHCEL